MVCVLNHFSERITERSIAYTKHWNPHHVWISAESFPNGFDSLEQESLSIRTHFKSLFSSLLFFLLFFFFFSVVSGQGHSIAQSAEYRLRKALLSSNDKMVRPVLKPSDVFNVTFDVQFQALSAVVSKLLNLSSHDIEHQF